jgi:hypothetical protein
MANEKRQTMIYKTLHRKLKIEHHYNRVRIRLLRKGGKFLISDLRQVWFSPDTHVSSTGKTDGYDITELLLKVALSIITITNIISCRKKRRTWMTISLRIIIPCSLINVDLTKTKR